MVTNDRESTQKPSGALAGIAASMPTLFACVSCALFGVGAGARGGVEGVWHAIRDMGVAFWFVAIAMGVAWALTSVLLFLAGRGMRIPAAITVFCAALPWAAGVAGVSLGMSRVADAVVNADPSMRAMLVAAGISEATHARLLGAIMASGFLAAVAFGLAFAALGQRAPRRSMAALAIGLVVSLPLLGIAAFGALGSELGVLSVGSAILLLAGLGAVLAVALGAAGAGADEPHGRSGALAASVPIAAGLAILAACAAAMSVALIEIFGAIALADPGSRGSLIGRAAMELSPLAWTMKLGLPLASIGAAAIAGWAAIRARPSVGRIAGGAALAVAAVLVVMLDASVMSSAASVIELGNRAEWGSVEGFEPIALPDVERAGESDAIVTTSGLVATDGSMLSGFDVAALSSALVRLRDSEGADGWMLEGERPDGDAEPLSTEPELVLAIDRRVSASQLRALLEGAHAGGIRALAFTGTLEGGPSEEEADAVREVLPMLTLVLAGRGSVRVVLESALPAEMPASDAVLHHVIVSDAIPTQTITRAGATVDAEERAIRESSYAPRHPSTPLYVGFADQASIESVLLTAARATESGFRPILVRSAIPGEPSRPHVEEESGLGRIGEGNFGFGGLGMLGGTPGGTSMDVRGSLSREVITRIVRRHQREIRTCYERGLMRRPELSGRVTVSFVISPTGTVESASIASTTLEDAQVEACIVRAVRTWTFPAPDGGGVVSVNYPFVFQSE